MDIYINNLPFNVDEGHLQILFEPFGNVLSTTIVKDTRSGRSKGFGFVKMQNPLDAERAIDDMNGRELAGKLLFVQLAKESYSQSSPIFEQQKDQEIEGGKKFHPKKRVFDEDKWGSLSKNFTPFPDNNEKIDLEVKDEASFSKETMENGFVQIKFKR
jgi:RNA recognition motif-containing protein